MLALKELTQFFDRNISSVFATHLKPKSRAFLNISSCNTENRGGWWCYFIARGVDTPP